MVLDTVRLKNERLRGKVESSVWHLKKHTIVDVDENFFTWQQEAVHQESVVLIVEKQLFLFSREAVRCSQYKAIQLSLSLKDMSLVFDFCVAFLMRELPLWETLKVP